MTHHDALEHHRRQLHSEPECHRELVRLGPDPERPGCKRWCCSDCGVVLSIDPEGLIRHRGRLPAKATHRMIDEMVRELRPAPPFPPPPADPRD